MKNKWPKKLLFYALLVVCPVLAQAAGVDHKSVSMPGKPVSIPERFHSYSGVRNLSAMGELFVNPHPSGIIQLPKIAVSDGASNVVIELKLTGEAAFAPNFAAKGAKLVSISHPVADKWVATVLPDKGSWNSSLIIMNSAVVLEVPLVVTPALPSGIAPDVNILFAHTDNKENLGTITRDLNEDGKLDYLDDYVFTANYLVGKQSVKSANEPTKGENASSLPVPPVSQNPGSGPGIDPKSGTGIKPVLDVDRHSPASRNERARKMKEQLK